MRFEKIRKKRRNNRIFKNYIKSFLKFIEIDPRNNREIL